MLIQLYIQFMALHLFQNINNYNIFAQQKPIRMKKQTLLLLAGGMLAFASCNNAPAGGGGMSQAQVDSAVNARVDAMRTELTMQNDSLINAMAQIKADSMIAAMKNGAPAPKPVAKAKPKASIPGAVSKNTSTQTTSAPAANTPTGKNSTAQQNGTPTGKNSTSQQTEGQPTGKRQH